MSRKETTLTKNKDRHVYLKDWERWSNPIIFCFLKRIIFCHMCICMSVYVLQQNNVVSTTNHYDNTTYRSSSSRNMFPKKMMIMKITKSPAISDCWIKPIACHCIDMIVSFQKWKQIHVSPVIHVCMCVYVCTTMHVCITCR